MKIRLKGREKMGQGDIAPAGDMFPEQMDLTQRQISHRQFLKACGLGVLAAGVGLAGDMALQPTPVSAYTYNEDLYVTGNVGIAMTGPAAARLHISGTNQELRLDWNGTADHHGSLRWAGLQLGNNGENRIVAGRTATGGALAFYVNNTVEAADYSVTPNGTLAMYISSSANVGIGVQSPQRKLHVGGPVLVEGNVTINPYNDLQVVTGNYYTALQGKYGEVGASEALYVTSNWDWHAGVRPWATQTTGTAAIRIRTRGEQTISLMTNTTDLAPLERLTVIGNGNVGIGKTDPAGALDVAGDIFVNGAPAIDASGVARQCYYAQ